jgi:hypothetical protein
MKVDNAEIWDEYVKTGKVKGFSIEGFFADKSTVMNRHESKLEQLKNLLNEYAKETN